MSGVRRAVVASALLWYATSATAEFVAYFQSHRGGMDEAPENTMAALRHAWTIPGSVPEVDLRTTADGHIICVHDETLARTSNAPADVAGTPVADLPLDQVRQYDVGAWFDAAYAGERVPTLREVLAMMQEDTARQLYLDLKAVDDDALRALLEVYGVLDRVLFVHGSPARCAELQAAFPGCRTMTWIGGTPDRIRQGYAELAAAGFDGLSQLQFHLADVEGSSPIEYVLDADFLQRAAAETYAAGVALQVRPFRFDSASLRALMDRGIYWYVADAPAAFHNALMKARE